MRLPRHHAVLPRPAWAVLPFAALWLAACSSDDYRAQGLAQGFKGQVDWVRDAFGQPVAPVTADAPNAAFPDIPDDQRPLARSRKLREQMIQDLESDHRAADQTLLALGQDDPTRYLTATRMGAPPPPIAINSEPLPMPDGARDIDSCDPRAAAAWLSLATLEFAEGSAELPADSEAALAQAAALLNQTTTLRVMGYSASRRLALPGKGPHEANRWLADQRARRVAAALVAMGAPPRQLLVGAAPEDRRGSADMVEIIIDY